MKKCSIIILLVTTFNIYAKDSLEHCKPKMSISNDSIENLIESVNASNVFEKCQSIDVSGKIKINSDKVLTDSQSIELRSDLRKMLIDQCSRDVVSFESMFLEWDKHALSIEIFKDKNNLSFSAFLSGEIASVSYSKFSMPAKFKYDLKTVDIPQNSNVKIIDYRDIDINRVKYHPQNIALAIGKNNQKELALSGITVSLPSSYYNNHHIDETHKYEGFHLDFKGTQNLKSVIVGYTFSKVYENKSSHINSAWDFGLGGMVIMNDDVAAGGINFRKRAESLTCSKGDSSNRICFKTAGHIGAILTMNDHFSLGVDFSAQVALSLQKGLTKKNDQYLYMDFGINAQGAAVVLESNKGVALEALPGITLGLAH